jgi:NAD(P)-dependent dehydrogenase (short-subunit alcohol dehydrogenase family)
MSTVRRPAAIVTGVSGSIGLAVSRRLADRGLASIGWDRSCPPAELVDEFFLCDLLDEADLASAGRAAVGSGHTVQHVIAVAGGGDLDELTTPDVADETLEVFKRVVDLNLTTAFLTIRTTLPLLREAAGDRSITLISSINALGGYGAPGYSAAKAGLSGLVRSLAPVLGSDGIRINTLVLGTTRTENLIRLAEARNRPTHFLDAVAGRAPLRRVLEPEDVAGAAVAVALDMPGLTGADVVLDNGQTLIR